MHSKPLRLLGQNVVDRYMYILVFFDLPTLSKKDRYNAQKFRSFLIDDGYVMLQLSVYSRICKGPDGVEKHIKRITANLPSSGSVRLLEVTEKQYGRMKLLLGERKKEEIIAPQQLFLL
jgi:CRISPR-associated protein Cas2